MSLKRRQFLILSSVAGGFGLAVAAQRLFGQQVRLQQPSSPAANRPVPSASPVTRPAPKPEAIGPKGMFAPVRGDVRLVVISDLNSAYGSTTYEPEVAQGIALAPDWQPDLVLCGGDMVAGQSLELSEAEIRAMWAGFDRTVAAPLRQAKLPFGFTIGNHDASSSANARGDYDFAADRQMAAAYWNDPKHNPGLPFVDRAQFPFYYTFQQNDVFYLVWDASNAKIPEAQLQWVERSLASPAAQAAKMRIVIGHLPLYGVAVNRAKVGEMLEQPERLRSLLERYDVHTYISGHHHAYYPARRGKLELLHTGALGAGPRRLVDSDLPPRKTLTVIDIRLATQLTTYTTYDMQTLQVISYSELPRLLTSPNGTVVRRDLKNSDLTAAERSLLS